jgi:hypothetical protein
MDKNGNRLGARRTVGPADPATRRRMLDAALKTDPAPPARAKRQPANDSYTTSTGVSPNTARLLRDRGKQIDSEVDKRDK